MTFVPALSVLSSVYNGEKFLPGFLENLRTQTLFPELELVIVLNEPSLVEERLAKDFGAKYSQQVQVLKVNKVETLSASWNRAWAAARAPYLAICNIDDRRLPASLGRQLSELEQNSDWVLCYGDYLAVSAYGKEEGMRRNTPAYSSTHFSRAFAEGGAFWVFRRGLAEQAGYFDEQFEVAADMELSLRIAAMELQMGRCEYLLGYFTDAAQGLSTRGGAKRAMIERTAVQLRYAVFDKVDPRLKQEALVYRIDAIKSFGEWHNVSEYLPNYENYVRRRQPLRLLGSLRFGWRTLLTRLGLLKLLHRVQNAFWKREF